ncbi:hypothetical protein NBRC111894_2779 [Sporolactobacillus inulinus]|uniref:Uncharacterized protein n=1 Tax=Sporolactobacillus inulinus TaxID=2078 RepID=A0A4Y1ZDS4_9BACL|nr:hypothetical protein NBRC111894_2779 [Sporolactobacillus inulinus]
MPSSSESIQTAFYYTAAKQPVIAAAFLFCSVSTDLYTFLSTNPDARH